MSGDKRAKADTQAKGTLSVRVVGIGLLRCSNPDAAGPRTRPALRGKALPVELQTPQLRTMGTT